MRRFFAAICFFLVLIFSFSCQRELQLKPASSDGEDFYQANVAAALQTFTVRSDKLILLKGRKGTLLSIDAFSLVDKDGKQLTGEVHIQLLEIVSPADMILYNKTTSSAGMPLQS